MSFLEPKECNFFALDSDDERNLISDCLVVGLSETWATSQFKVPGYMSHMECYQSPAKKEHAVGRARGGLALLVDKNQFKYPSLLESNSMWIAVKGNVNGKDLIIVNIYLKDIFFKHRLEALVESLREWTIIEGCTLVVGGDFNSRIGNQLDDELVGSAYLTGTRASMDPVINKNGVALVEAMEELGLIVLNGCSLSDKSSGVTFVGNTGTSVIDQIWVKADCLELFTDFYIPHLGLSDHWPVAAIMEWETNHQDTTNQPSNVEISVFRWDRNGAEQYRKELIDILPPKLNNVEEMASCIASTIKTV